MILVVREVLIVFLNKIDSLDLKLNLVGMLMIFLESK